jgi:hypothetical protein
MAAFFTIIFVVTVLSLALSHRKGTEREIRRLTHDIHRIRRRTTRITRRTRQGIEAAPWQRRHTRPDDPHDPDRKYEGRWR